jgi:cation transport regulator
MPYEKNSELPKSVRDSLPDAAQTIYLKAYNSAHEQNPDYGEERLAKISWSAVKKTYHKSNDNWVKSELIGAESPPENYDPATHVVKAIKIGTVAHTPEGEPFACTAEWLEAHAADWNGGKLIANHNGAMSESFGDITRAWWEPPFVMMEIGGMSTDAETRMMSNQHTGFSFDAVGYPDDPDSVFGTDLSILFFPHYPACPATEGCGLASETKDVLHSHIVKTEDIQKHIGSEVMADDKTYTRAEIDQQKLQQSLLLLRQKLRPTRVVSLH